VRIKEQKSVTNKGIDNKVISATKWSAITELVARVIGPLTTVILARIIAPEAFGIVATVTMIVSFADMFTDSGFQKYLVQHEFKSKIEKYKNANVAFWTNLLISLLLWGIIYLFREQIADLVGNPGLGNLLAIACLQLPLTSFSSIQMALFRRDFDFKTLFFVRLISIFIPIILTIPLALLGLSYWALVIGNLTMQLSNAIVLTIKSNWKPNFMFSFKILKEMFSFSIWSLIEAISIWFTTWVDTFIIGRFFNQHQLGLYKTPTSMVNSIMALITGSIVPVLFASLSRLQDNPDKFKNLYFKFQRLASILLFPLGVGIYLYSDVATTLLLGSQWEEASPLIGIWALSSALMIVFGFFSSEAYRAKGKPKLSLFAQLLHLIVLVPVCIVAGKYGFWALVYARTLVRLQFILVHLIIMKFSIGIPILKTFRNVFPTLITAILMGIFGYLLQQISNGIIWTILSIFLCVIFYFSILLLFPKMKTELWEIKIKLIPKKT
jgi:O-antigen/teichoic acid export membrane protein